MTEINKTLLKGMNRRLFLGAAGGALALTLMPSIAAAQSVQEIKDRKVLKAGVQVAQVPWGYTDESGKLTGFDVEFVRLIAKELGVDVEFVPVTPANRIATLLTGQVDMLAAVMGIFPDRQKVVLFSRPYCNNDNVFIGRADLKASGWDDLNGARVGVPRGTPQDKAVTTANPAGATIQRFDDDASTVQALISGQVDIIGAAFTQLGNIEKVAGPGKFEQKFVLSRVFNGVAVRPQSREFADHLNGVIGKLIESGELSALYKQWIGKDMVAELPTTGEGDAPLPVEIPN
ncbi:transporter substrate-binding domain-containing protein [Shinella oryzae]|uniref:transporter substrate-binding domain-containing protein n=1 Tax=Shinella oryzae TaxID=2871820 RepID=UPI001FF2C9BB|nr:transporter substrate-binding domain-containing protein [Shinella oryzae]UPA27216.1 transporter substrate-binding domain-containing protein [Shinella oryzae]